MTPTIGDFADHMTTAFTDVRVKRFLEMRGADAGRADMMVAQSALWVGLLYDEAALAAAAALVREHDLGGRDGVAGGGAAAGAGGFVPGGNAARSGPRRRGDRDAMDCARATGVIKDGQ